MEGENNGVFNPVSIGYTIYDIIYKHKYQGSPIDILVCN